MASTYSPAPLANAEPTQSAGLQQSNLGTATQILPRIVQSRTSLDLQQAQASQANALPTAPTSSVRHNGSANNRPPRKLAQPLGPQWTQSFLQAETEKYELGRLKKEKEALEEKRKMTRDVYFWHTVSSPRPR